MNRAKIYLALSVLMFLVCAVVVGIFLSAYAKANKAEPPVKESAGIFHLAYA
jgi:hypothetical protein